MYVCRINFPLYISHFPSQATRALYYPVFQILTRLGYEVLIFSTGDYLLQYNTNPIQVLDICFWAISPCAGLCFFVIYCRLHPRSLPRLKELMHTGPGIIMIEALSCSRYLRGLGRGRAASAGNADTTTSTSLGGGSSPNPIYLNHSSDLNHNSHFKLSIEITNKDHNNDLPEANWGQLEAISNSNSSNNNNNNYGPRSEGSGTDSIGGRKESREVEMRSESGVRDVRSPSLASNGSGVSVGWGSLPRASFLSSIRDDNRDFEEILRDMLDEDEEKL